MLTDRAQQFLRRTLGRDLVPLRQYRVKGVAAILLHRYESAQVVAAHVVFALAIGLPDVEYRPGHRLACRPVDHLAKHGERRLAFGKFTLVQATVLAQRCTRLVERPSEIRGGAAGLTLG